jgi:hypothetical protein
MDESNSMRIFLPSTRRESAARLAEPVNSNAARNPRTRLYLNSPLLFQDETIMGEWRAAAVRFRRL